MDKSNKIASSQEGDLAGKEEQQDQVEKIARLKLEREKILADNSKERIAAQEETSKPLLDQSPETNA